MSDRETNLDVLREVRRALLDKTTKPEDYCIVRFGYCAFCNALTSYDIYKEVLQCEKCNRSFTESVDNQWEPAIQEKQHPSCGNYITKREQIPSHLTETLDSMHSREQQELYFTMALSTLQHNMRTELNILQMKLAEINRLFLF